MVLYHVTWKYSPELAKGKKKPKSTIEIISVICRNSKDALAAFAWHFERQYNSNSGVSLDDGSITLQRSVVDSRNFTAKYLFMDGIKNPLALGDLEQSLFDYSKHYNLPYLR